MASGASRYPIFLAAVAVPALPRLTQHAESVKAASAVHWKLVGIASQPVSEPAVAATAGSSLGIVGDSLTWTC